MTALLETLPRDQAFPPVSLRLLSAASLLEASIVIEARKSEAGGRELDLLP